MHYYDIYKYITGLTGLISNRLVCQTLFHTSSSLSAGGNWREQSVIVIVNNHSRTSLNNTPRDSFWNPNDNVNIEQYMS